VGLTLAGPQVDAGVSEGTEGGWVTEMLQGLALAEELDGVAALSIEHWVGMLMSAYVQKFPMHAT